MGFLEKPAQSVLLGFQFLDFVYTEIFVSITSTAWMVDMCYTVTIINL